MVPDSRGISISPLWWPLCHVVGNDCNIVFISLKSTEKVQRVTLSCSCCFTDTVTEIWVALKWQNSLWNFSTFSVTFTHATGPSHFVNAMQVHRLLWVIKYSTQVSDPFCSPTPLVTKWHDRHGYLSIHHVPYLMSLNSPRHCSKILKS